MNAWLADASNLQNHDNGAFHQTTIDPATAFLHASPTPPDPNQFQRMFNNGVPRNASPGFHNPNQVIPSKRSRPEDGMSMSPRQAPGGLSASRSQTPHQVPFPGYQGPANGAQQFPSHAAPYQHLQQGTPTNVTQSPIMQDFDQHGVQRMGTASPSPFSPAGHHVGGPHMSPSQSDHPSRVNTPQNNTFIPGQPFPQGMGPQFSPAPTMTTGAVQAPMQAHFSNMPQYQQAMAAQQQRLHALQMQNQGRPINMNPAMAGRPVAAGMNAMANPQQMAAIRQMQQNMAKPPNPEGFMRSLQKFMMSRNMHLDPNPIVCGRPINLVQLYATVMKLGGSKKITAANMWPVIAQQLQFPPMQFPMAVQEIREHYQRNLAAYEQAFLSTQQKQFTDQMQQNALPRQASDPSAMQFQSPTVKQSQGFETPQQAGHGSPSGAPMANNVPHGVPNGFPAPTQAKAPSKQQQQQQQHRLSVSRQSQPPATPQDSTGQLASQSPAQPAKPLGSVPGKTTESFEQPPNEPLKHPIEDPFKPMVLPESNLHGPIVVDEMYQLGEEISRLKPDVPSFLELGVIDIHALTMGIKSGIHAEMRLALDTLVTISCEPGIPISLDNCEDLVDSLVECAEDQADLLAEHAVEVSDVMLLPPYEEITRGCQAEWTSLADVPEFGSLEYELDRAVDRLICITTILRNFSFTESNFAILSTPSVVQFMSTIIRYLGTRNMLLRTHQNTLDFMKDAVTYLSNLAHLIQLPSIEEAHCLLHFLLSFAPFPAPTIGPDGVMFTPYNASIHKYTPAAVDSLAKLLARDDPNRTFFKAIFSSDAGSTAQYELLTRAFGLAICPVPDQLRKHLAIADARKVFLMQGLLAADILSSFADGTLAQQWLESTDGFAIHLLRLSCLLSTERVPPPPTNTRQSHAARGQAEEAAAYGSIINRGLTILCRLAERSKLADSNSTRQFPSGIIPKKESLLGALLMPNVDPGVVRQLISYARLAE
ncbi:putative ARID/BRIGHT domain protein (SWI1) [Aspergillus clavatus NRRL 1]|uniref:ARID/BRIGHT domain protein (SWI1), putative n=1 Tax=Aspergillus clavatus (strain ATCC 1007 / CBS 513.65 / DSM 816 / NCTC 3887 / NRRL 1 / QM 1276 / 107) TaxID=344612 RepID=A1CKN9_ASPCL|nr:ARID/BRIGHT domain protein (SWI1), putative [Aspergillus clavatus NRRL 1]EAW09713.1 ARID/BRIGHT domain protein (SWI1), putative [Aspergillus clavatus NRRL 1]